MKKYANHKLMLIIGLFLTIILVSGGTFAYFQWQSSLEDKTNVIVSVTDNITMTINPAAVTKTGMRPTNNCGGDAGMSGVSTVTIDNQTGILARPRFKLKIKITDSEGNNITNEESPMGNTYMYYVKYAVTEEDGDCTSPLISGRFSETTETIVGSGWYDSPSLTLSDSNNFPAISSETNLGVSFDAAANTVTSHTYKVWIWIDNNYVTTNTGDNTIIDMLQNATVTVSWSENSTVEQVRGGGTVEMMAGEAYAVYSADDTSLRFYRSETPIEVGSTYNGLTATAVYTGFEDTSYSGYAGYSRVLWYSYRESITKVIFEDVIVPISTENWFYEFKNCISIDVTKLNTSNVTNMGAMFSSAGLNVTTFNIVGLENWDVSKVTDMSSMFYRAGTKATTFELDLSEWDVSKVTDMASMFGSLGGYGYTTTLFELNLSGWDTSNVTNMGAMFSSAGYDATTFNIIGLENWNVSKVTNMRYMFSSAGYSATTFELDLSEWDVSNVTSMYHMFDSIGYESTTWSIGDISTWDTINVTNMSGMFETAGKSSDYILDLSGWNVNNVHYWEGFNTEVSSKIISPIWITGDIYGYAVYSEDDNSLRFYDISNTITEGGTFNNLTVTNKYTLYQDKWYDYYTVPWVDYQESITNVVVEDEISPTSTGHWFYYLKNCTNIDVMKLNTSNVTNMSDMFSWAGSNVTTFSIIGLENLDTSNVTSMAAMFNRTGYKATTFSLNLNGWDTSNVTNMSDMFSSAGRSATTFSLNLNGWDTSNVTNMSNMFSSAGYSATTFKLNLSSWDTSSVTNMYHMFFSAGQSATTFELNLSGWDTSNVTAMSWMFAHAGKSAATFNITGLSTWDTSSVTDMDRMFAWAGQAATTFNITGLENWDTSSVTNMCAMFSSTGQNADYTLDLSDWNVCNVTSYVNFNTDVEDKITAPSWGMSCPTT